jgi:uncharacterized protein (TIGR02466 family)
LAIKRSSSFRCFSTEIYQADLFSEGSKFNRELVTECGQIEVFDEEGQSWSKKNYPSGFTSYSSRNDLHYFSSTFRELEEKIRPHAYAYASILDYDLNGYELVMTDCWLNIMRKGAVHTSHIHPLSFISGTYYVQLPRGASGIKFEDPRLVMMMAAPPKNPTTKKQNRQFVELKPAAGKLVLFESWLRHEVPPMQVEGERISVSFNYAFVVEGQ